MPKMESIIRAEKDNEKVIIYVKNDDGSEIRQEYPLFNEQGKPNAVANMIYDFAAKKIAEQSKTLNTNNVQTTITSDSKPAQSTTNSIQAPVQSTPQIGNIINTPSDLILAIQKLNPNVDILLSKSALNNHAPERMGINVDINNIKLPQGSSFEKNDDNIKLKYNGTNISIDVCPSAKRGEVDIFYWKGSPLDGIKLTKDIKDLSMSTDALEIANALNELNTHDIFRINNGKLETSINYDYYKILCPLGIDYVYDKQTHTAHLENRAGLKLDVEYNYRMDLELAKLTDPETAKYKGHVVLRDHYPTEEQKRIALASIDTP